MDKRRLLLFSIFALLHITTSERNFIDAKYECCNHSLRFSSDINFLTHETTRQHFGPVIRQINNPNKNLNLRDTEKRQLSTRRHIENGEDHSRDAKIRGVIDKQRKRILINPTNKLQGREVFRERNNERRNVSPNESRRNRFAGIRDREHTRDFKTNTLSRYDIRKYDIVRNRFESRDVNRRNYNNRYQYARSTHASTNERKMFSGNDERRSNLENIIREQSNLRPVVAMASERENVVDILAERKVAHRKNRNLEENSSETKSLRRHLLRENDRRSNRDNFRKNKRFVSDNTRRSLLGDNDNQNLLNKMPKQSGDLRFRSNNVLRDSSRENEIQLREINMSRKNVANGRDRVITTENNSHVTFNTFDDNRQRNNRLLNGRNSLEEMSQDIRNDARIQFYRRTAHYDARYNRDTNEREASVRRDGINNSKRYVEMSRRDNTLESRHSVKNVLFESNNIRDINGNIFSTRRNLIDKTLEKDNKKTIQTNLPTEEFRAREESRKYKWIKNRNNEATDKIIQRQSEKIGLSLEFRERDENRHSLRDSRYVKFSNNRLNAEHEDRRGVNDDRIRNRNVQRKVDNHSRLITQQKNKINMFSRIDRDVISARRDSHIASVGDVLRQRSSRIMNNLAQATNRGHDNRKINDERNARNSREERLYAAQRIANVVNERRYSTTEFSDREKSIMTHQIQYNTNIFEMKWQYLFYVLQIIYLCSVCMKIPKDEANKKQKIRMADWFTPAEDLKVD